MNRTWDFTDLEFAAAWDATQADLVPEPFVYTSETKYYDDAREAMRQAWGDVLSRWGAEVTEILAAVAMPDIRLIIRGLDGQDPLNPKKIVRMLATRKGDYAYLITQKPGRTFWHAGGFTISEHEVLSLGDTVAAALPKAEAGRQSDFVLVQPRAEEEFDYSYGRSRIQDFDDGVDRRSAEFNNATVDLDGTITVQQGYSRFGPRGITNMYLRWCDLVDDGRYVVVPGQPTTVVAADTRRLGALINTQIAEVVRAIKDDRA
ncbi:ESAT-6 protein secretion system EspG family protein [Nocardia tenerifensis]|uniref:ESAT-6 protein secretion system EspG family protein n=1 Tax=Nocardia tenerifensis TaxID=228006 RepID=A0A318KSX6_9NOCA|nr:ESX secretion-associated protein EspG [Nocardia tenerifensis]PXX66587.1 ESAT-6 protein secretion system EspG family protein [Nocardia tenerifensis]